MTVNQLIIDHLQTWNLKISQISCAHSVLNYFIITCSFKTESENTNDGMDDEEKDPEYNYLAEVDDLIDSDEELRDDRAVKISSQFIMLFYKL